MYTIPATTTINKKMVEEAIEYNQSKRSHYNTMYDYYAGKHLILDRQRPTMKKNNKVVVNHAKYIVDTFSGYLLGNSVEYQVDDGYDIQVALDAYRKQTIADLDNELRKDLGIFGKAYERVYVSDNEIKSASVDPRNCIVVYDDTVEHNKLFAVIYSYDDTGKNLEDAIVLDRNFIYQYSINGQLQMVADGVEQHFFGDVPVVEYRNDSEEQGDFEQVKTLIDAYNLLMSDRVNDKEQLVDAIMAMYGVDLTEDQKTLLKTSRVMSGLPDNARIEYITKTLNETEVDVLRQVIESDIHKISMCPNMADENFAGNSSGVALRYKLLSFEQATKNKERYLEKGLLNRFGLYNSYLVKLNKMSEVPVYEVDVVFKRNLPQNDYETSQMLANLITLIDSETLIGQLSFIKDAKEILEAKAKEDELRSNRDLAEFGTDQVTGSAKDGSEDLEEEEKTIFQKISGYLNK